MKVWAGFLLRFGLVIALLLGAWGFDDIRGFFAHPARLALVAVLAGLGITGAFLFPNLPGLTKGEKRTGTALTFTWIVVSLLMAVWYPYADRREMLVFDAGWLRYAGLLLFAAGMSFRLYSALWLGRQLSGHVAIQKDHQLIQGGPYSLIRHPLYVGLVVAYAGLGLVFRSWIVIAAVAMSVAFVLLRMRQEETLLAREFGAEFENYRRRTWRLVPRVY